MFGLCFRVTILSLRKIRVGTQVGTGSRKHEGILLADSLSVSLTDSSSFSFLKQPRATCLGEWCHPLWSGAHLHPLTVKPVPRDMLTGQSDLSNSSKMFLLPR